MHEVGTAMTRSVYITSGVCNDNRVPAFVRQRTDRFLPDSYNAVEVQLAGTITAVDVTQSFSPELPRRTGQQEKIDKRDSFIVFRTVLMILFSSALPE